MANRNAAYKDVMNELRGKIKEHSASKFRKEESDEEESEESEEESEDEDADKMSEELPEGPDFCSNCDGKMDAKHKFCANCGTKR